MTFEWYILISNIMRIAIQCHPSLCYVMYLGTLLFVVQRNVFISLSWFLLGLINCVLQVPTYQRDLRADVLLCQRVLHAYVPTCLACLRAQVPWCLACLRAHVPTCLACLCALVPTCLTYLRAHVPACLVCLRVYVPTCLECLRAHGPTYLACFFVPTFVHAHVMQLQITISFQ